MNQWFSTIKYPIKEPTLNHQFFTNFFKKSLFGFFFIVRLLQKKIYEKIWEIWWYFYVKMIWGCLHKQVNDFFHKREHDMVC